MFSDLHDLQWLLCIMQKLCNPCYHRPRPDDRLMIKLPLDVIAWRRLLGLRHWRKLRMHILSLGLEKELDSFETSVQMNVSQQLREITCRTCLGLSDKSHGE